MRKLLSPARYWRRIDQRGIAIFVEKGQSLPSNPDDPANSCVQENLWVNRIGKDMAEDSMPGPPAAGANAAELELRRYEARLGVWKVVLGTFIVGLAGILIPGAINFYTAHFENLRKDIELRHSQQIAHQQYIKDFFSTAINQDIELRIRFADYFASLSGSGQEKLWKSYLTNLKELRDRNRTIINELENQLVEFKRLPPEQIDNAEFDRINRELAWANAEIGYVPTERSAVVASAESGPIGKKVRLYRETTELVRRLASAQGALREHPDDLARFWNLYRTELIGVESPDFARKMIEIGQVLISLAASNSAPDATLTRLAEELDSISRREVADVSQAAIQQQQQQQMLMPQQLQLQ